MAEMKEVIKPEVKAKVLYSGLIKYMVFFLFLYVIYILISTYNSL